MSVQLALHRSLSRRQILAQFAKRLRLHIVSPRKQHAHVRQWLALQINYPTTMTQCSAPIVAEGDLVDMNSILLELSKAWSRSRRMTSRRGIVCRDGCMVDGGNGTEGMGILEPPYFFPGRCG